MENLNNDINIYSEEVKDVLTSPPRKIHRWGNTILFFFIFLMVILSYLIKYPDIIKGQAILTTETPPQKEYARVSGKIQNIFIKNNQKIKERDVIAVIENSANYHDVLYLKNFIDSVKINSENFLFPIEKLPVLFLGEIEKPFALFENNYLEYILNRKSNSFIYEDTNNKNLLKRLKARLKTTLGKRKINEEELFFLQKNLKRMKELFEKGVISAQNYEQKKIEFLQAQRNASDLKIIISQIKDDIGNIGNSTKQEQIQNQRKEINLLKNVLQSFDELKRAISEWELKYLFRAKINGVVSFMSIWNKNQFVSSNDLVFTVLPSENSEYVCKVEIPIINSGKLEIGQTVNIKLSNFPDHEFGVLKGKLKKITLIPNKQRFYIIDVSLPNGLITTYGKEIVFSQEMQGVAEVITEDLRLIERVFYRFKKLFNNI